MAVLAAAQLLDELMGRNRNIAPNEKINELNWEDSEYCKYFMVKFCPHDLFVNTRADLGACTKTHDEEIRRLFHETKKTHHKKLQYQEDFLRFCMSMIGEVDRKIIKGKQRLALSGMNLLIAGNPAQTEKNQEQINMLSERINQLEKEAEEAGTDGNVEQAQGLMKLCDQLKDERDGLKKQLEIGHWNATAQLAVDQEKQMEVCEVCGAFLIVGDAQQRIDDHLMGKQHMGYTRLKKAVEEISALVKEARDGRRGTRDKAKKERRRDKEKDKDKKKEEKEKDTDDKEKKNSEQGEKDKEREREKREREKEKEKRRAEEKEKREKDRDRERHDRERDRDSSSRDRNKRDFDRNKRHFDDFDEDRHRHRHSSHRYRR